MDLCYTTSMTTRTYIHRPSALVTEDYEFVACGSFEPGCSPVDLIRLLADEGWHFGENRAAGNCYHCGAHFMYYAILKHLPSHTLIRVGETCLDNRFDLASTEFHKLRKEAKLNRERTTVQEKRDEFEAARPGIAQELQEHSERNDFFASLYSQLERKGVLSDAQVDAAVKSLARQREWDLERKEEEASEPTPAPVITGRIQVTGKVLTVKTQDGMYGPTQKMLVLDNRGFKIWGTCPSKIEGEWADGLRGEHITFLASVEKSDDDENFGFYKRPMKAKVIV
jgi:hypothetical protein